MQRATFIPGLLGLALFVAPACSYFERDVRAQAREDSSTSSPAPALTPGPMPRAPRKSFVQATLPKLGAYAAFGYV